MTGPRQDAASKMLAYSIVTASLAGVTLQSILDDLEGLNAIREFGGLAQTFLEVLDERHAAMYAAVADLADGVDPMDRVWNRLVGFG
jgi:hypothetical protein